MKKTPVILIAVVIAAVIAICGALGYKLVKAKPGEELTTDFVTGESSFTEYTEPDIIPEEITDFSETEISSEPASTVLPELTSAAQAESQQAKSTDESTVTEKITTVATTVAAKVNASFDKIFKMPKAPKYVPPAVEIDFDNTSVLAYKYDPNGNYFYTDDKNAWQRGFGYNQIYDSLAVISAMYYDTVRNTFSYDGKDWLIQFWKGQYGYYFVGAEIGIYTKTKRGSTYTCAEKQDWMKMEMTFYWDQNKSGSYSPIFSRPYTDYWWCTGFVPGLESLASMKSREQFRIVGHITFKSTEMAELFCEQMQKNGFKRVSLFDKDIKDTFVQAGADVGFCWQSINQHVI